MSTTTDSTVTMYQIGQYAGAGQAAMDEFEAMRETYAALPADAIATYEYAEGATIIDDTTDQPMTNGQVVAYVVDELSRWEA